MTDHARRLASAASGDDEALALLVRAYHDRVYRFGVKVWTDRAARVVKETTSETILCFGAGRMARWLELP